MSSSTTAPLSCSALLTKKLDDQTPVGPIQLPIENSIDFIAQFNRLYGPIGLQIIANQLQPPAHEKNSAATNGCDGVLNVKDSI